MKKKILIVLFAAASFFISEQVAAQPGPVPSPWIVNGNSIYYSRGAVGIGTSTPNATNALTVKANSTGAGLNLVPGAAPASPLNGDLWTTSSGFFARVNGATTNLLSAPQLTPDGGLIVSGNVGLTSSCAARVDIIINACNNSSNQSHIAFGAVNTVPGFGAGQSPETSFTGFTNYGGALRETVSFTTGLATTFQGNSTTSTSITNNITHSAWEVLGRLSSTDIANNVALGFSNNSLYLIPGATSSNYDQKPPPANWVYDQGYMNIGGGGTVGGGLQSYTGTASSSTAVLTSVTPDPTAAATFLQIGSVLVGTNLPYGATVSATTSNSITFTGGNAGASGSTTATSYPNPTPNVGWEVAGANAAGFLRGARTFGGNGMTIGYDAGTSRSFLQADNLISSTLLPMEVQGTDIKFNVGSTPGSVTNLAEIGAAGFALKLPAVAGLVPLSVNRVNGKSSISDDSGQGLALDGGTNTDVYVNAFSSGNVYLGSGGGGVAAGSATPQGANTFNVAKYYAGGTGGITETCSVTPTAITIKGGIITAFTGGTCTP